MRISDINSLSEKDISMEMKKARKQKKNFFQFRHKLASGELRDVDVHSTPIKFLDRDYLFSVIIDVTDRKKIEKKLTESEQKLKNYINSAGEGIVLSDEEGSIIEWNKAMEQITGYVEEEIKGKKIWEIQYELSTEPNKKPEYFDFLKDRIINCLKTGEAEWLNKIFEREIIDRAGTHKTVQTIVFPVRSEKGLMLGSSMRDISYLKQMEKTKADLEFKKRELATISVYLNQKNELLHNTKKQIKQLHSSEDTNVQIVLQQLEAMIDHNLNFDNDWKIYKSHFEEINEDFFRILNNRHPGLTQNELRHCAYIKMNFTTKEIARINNVKPTSIQIARVRLKKRLELSPESSLISYLQSI
jgi:PAS domain S-box-containing protein